MDDSLSKITFEINEKGDHFTITLSKRNQEIIIERDGMTKENEISLPTNIAKWLVSCLLDINDILKQGGE